MLLVEYFRWWYGPGWRDSANRLQSRLINIYFTFSVPIASIIALATRSLVRDQMSTTLL